MSSTGVLCGSQPIETQVVSVRAALDGAQKIDHAAIDFQIDFVPMPNCAGLRSAVAQVRCDHRPEMIHPAPNGFIGDRDATFRKINPRRRESSATVLEVKRDFDLLGLTMSVSFGRVKASAAASRVRAGRPPPIKLLLKDHIEQDRKLTRSGYNR
jgi:hypothetical protein